MPVITSRTIEYRIAPISLQIDGTVFVGLQAGYREENGDFTSLSAQGITIDAEQAAAMLSRTPEYPNAGMGRNIEHAVFDWLIGAGHVEGTVT